MLRLIVLVIVLLLLACWQPGCELEPADCSDLSDWSDMSDLSDASDESDSDSDFQTFSETDNTPPSGCEGALAFADSNLELAIRDAIAMPEGDIFYADVLNLESLTIMPPGTS